MADVSKLLHTTTVDETFLVNLEADQSLIRAARRKIRDRLREAFSRSSATTFGVEVRCRFFTQGSGSYRTLNDPAWPPRQQKDLDDGCYLPLSFLKGEKPSKAANLFFAFVDTVLKALAREEGWRHVPKPTCVRLVVAQDAHVDVPLYAIPDAEFRLLEARAALDSLHLARKAVPDTWERLPDDAVLLAHRENGWVRSDPRAISAWFIDAVKLYGERLRRDCRFLKAWRDHHQLDQANLTSIFIMACVWTAYEHIGGPFLPSREDERLLRIVDRMPAMIRGPMTIPACGTEDLNRIAEDERAWVARRVEGLRGELREIVERCSDPRRAVDILQASFGPRIPDKPELVEIKVAASLAVASYAPKVVAAPEVGRSRSG